MTVDWVHTPMYNTLMSLAAGVGLLLVVLLGREVYLRRDFSSDGYALGLGITGVIQFLMGLHMSLTWPLARIAAFDNIVFGEPAVAFGAMLLAAALYLWRRGEAFQPQEVPALDGGTARDDADSLRRLADAAFPLSLFAAAIGLGCFGIAAAGWRYTLWAAPPQEPISGNFAGHPLVEATFISLLYVLVGLGAVLLPVALLTLRPRVIAVVGVCWTLAGLAFTVFGALNYFTHIGLIINTS